MSTHEASSQIKLVIRKIRNIFVVGYWMESPHCYWSKTFWTPLQDFKDRKSAHQYVKSIVSV